MLKMLHKLANWKTVRKKVVMILSVMFLVNQLLFVLAYQLFLSSLLGQQPVDLLAYMWNTGTFSYVIVTEVVIFLLENLMVMLILILAFVRPLEQLQRMIQGYPSGVRPKRTDRLDELGRMQNNFVDLTEELEEEKQKQNQIIASISHDIKTPLTSVMGYAERLARKAARDGEASAFSERDQRYLRTIYEKSLRIRDLVEEFDDYLGVQLSQNLHRQTLTLGTLMQMVQEDYEDGLRLKGAALRVDCSDGDTLLSVDAAKLQRVFGNVVTNSARYLPPEDGHITLTARRVGEYARICIADNGCGVAPEDLERIFEPLYTSDESRSVAGLGLAICRSLVELHGGSIAARNNEEGGLSIDLVLPVLSVS